MRRFVKNLGKLQDALGAHNDAIVACQTVVGLEQDAGPTVSRAAGIVLGWCGHDATASDGHLKDTWRALSESASFLAMNRGRCADYLAERWQRYRFLADVENEAAISGAF